MSSRKSGKSAGGRANGKHAAPAVVLTENYDITDPTSFDHESAQATIDTDSNGVNGNDYNAGDDDGRDDENDEDSGGNDDTSATAHILSPTSAAETLLSAVIGPRQAKRPPPTKPAVISSVIPANHR